MNEIKMSTKKRTIANMTRREVYAAYTGVYPDEMAGATDLECELDLRGLTGEGAYGIKGYCSQQSVERCAVCSLCNYGRDCHNNRIAAV